MSKRFWMAVAAVVVSQTVAAADYAMLDGNGVVTNVVSGRDPGDGNTQAGWEAYYGGKYTNTSGYRKNYAGIGYTYDAVRDAFIPPKPFPSWVLNETTCNWEPPVAKPNDGQMYRWDEATVSWVLM